MLLPDLSRLSIISTQFRSKTTSALDFDLQQAVNTFWSERDTPGGERLAFQAASFILAFYGTLILEQDPWNVLAADTQVQVKRVLKTLFDEISSVRSNLLSFKWFSSSFLQSFDRAVLLRELSNFEKPPSGAICSACGKEDLQNAHCIELVVSDFYSAGLNRDALSVFVPGSWNAERLIEHPAEHGRAFRAFEKMYTSLSTRTPRKSRYVLGTTCHKLCVHRWTARTAVLEAIWDVSALNVQDRSMEAFTSDDRWLTSLSERLQTVHTVASYGDNRGQVLKVPTVEPQADADMWRAIDRALGEEGEGEGEGEDEEEEEEEEQSEEEDGEEDGEEEEECQIKRRTFKRSQTGLEESDDSSEESQDACVVQRQVKRRFVLDEDD
jgi:hypothetical protein